MQLFDATGTFIADNDDWRNFGQTCLVAGSYAPMSFEVAATVWGRVLPLTQFDREALAEFIREYRGERGPEAGVCRG